MKPISNEINVFLQGNVIPAATENSRSETRVDATVLQRGDVYRSFDISLTPPLTILNGQPEQKQFAEFNKLIASLSENINWVMPKVGNLIGSAFTSPAAFEIELGKLTSNLEKTQSKLKLQDIQRARELNDKKIGENQEKIKEAEDSAKEAKKAGVFGKIFGWLSAIASVVIGAIMVATGVGAAAGALMIAAGVVGMVNMSVQHAAEAGLISKEVMEKLGPALMGIEIALAVISMVVTFGASAGGMVAKLGAKIGGKVAEITAKLGTRAATEAVKVSAQAAKVLKLSTQGVDTALNISSGISKSIQSVKESKSMSAQADLLLNKTEMTELQAVIDKLKEVFSQMLEAFQQTMEQIFQMITAKGQMLSNIAQRPASV